MGSSLTLFNTPQDTTKSERNIDWEREYSEFWTVQKTLAFLEYKGFSHPDISKFFHKYIIDGDGLIAFEENTFLRERFAKELKQYKKFSQLNQGNFLLYSFDLTFDSLTELLNFSEKCLKEQRSIAQIAQSTIDNLPKRSHPPFASVRDILLCNFLALQLFLSF